MNVGHFPHQTLQTIEGNDGGDASFLHEGFCFNLCGAGKVVLGNRTNQSVPISVGYRKLMDTGRWRGMPRTKRGIGDKLAMNRVLRTNKWLARFIPDTRRMNRAVLKAMLGKYGMVYVKPCRGNKGRGVMRVEMERTGCRVREGTRNKRYAGVDEAYRAIMRAAGGKPYLVQQGIRVLRHGGRPFDVRVMVQRNPRGEWEATGQVGRVAHPRKVVTNGSQGGTIYPMDVLLKGHMDTKKRTALIATMRKISRQCAKQYGAARGGKEIGADIAIDGRHRLWIIEVNTIPDPCPFTKLNDKTMIRRIVRYGRAYGRKYRLNCTKAKKGV